MKLVIQIPCYNEAQTLPETLQDLPRAITGLDEIEWLVIDDGSQDNTAEVAESLGVDHVISLPQNRGLARAFLAGLDAAVALGADIIVNTDGDNQYAGADIPKLLQPILEGRADIVIGDRQTDKIAHFSRSKRIMQWFGSGVVRKLAGIWVPDVVSGFRAFSREAAIRTNIVSSFSYTIETVIQAGKKQLAVSSVPVETNPKTRESRLASSMPRFIQRQLNTMVRMYSMYQPLRVFFAIGLVLSVAGIVPIVRFLFFYFSGQGSGHIQSLILGGTLTVLGFITFLIALLADLIGFNRQLLETLLEKLRRIELRDRD